MNSNTKCLVTGSSGILGQALCIKLKSLGYEVEGLDVNPCAMVDSCNRGSEKCPHTTVHGTVDSKEFMTKVFTDFSPTVVFHTASLHRPNMDSREKQDFITTNVIGTINILQAANDCSATQCVVFTSTTSTFISMGIHDAPSDVCYWIDEDSAQAPRNIYGVSKLSAEHVCRMMHAETKLPITILNVGRFFPEQDLVERGMSDLNVKVFELLHRRAALRDMVGAHICAAEKMLNKELSFDRFIIASASPFVKDDFLNTTDPTAVLSKHNAKFCEMVKELGWKDAYPITRVYDSTKATKGLGWQPEVTFWKVFERVHRLVVKEGKSEEDMDVREFLY